MLTLLRALLGRSSMVFALLVMAAQVVSATESLSVRMPSGATSSSTTSEASQKESLVQKVVIPTSVAEASQAFSSVSSIDSQIALEPQSNAETQTSTLQGQVTSVSQLSDVKPTDWAFQALQSLVERYGCIVGYPDKTYRGNRALSRYEFAAGLNACMERINELIAAGAADLVKKEDLLAVQKLQEEFAAELATLKGRVDALEARTATLEKQQFSTTTKLRGNIIFALVKPFGGDKARTSGAGVRPQAPGQFGVPNSQRGLPAPGPIDDNAIFTDRVRLILNSSFSGRDQLIIRLQAGNTPSLFDATGTASAKLAFSSPSGNSLSINQLEYRFPIGDRGTAFVEAFGFLDLFVPTLHPLDGDYDTVLTGFALRSPIYFPSGVTGAGFNYNITDKINLGGGYLAGKPTANDPASGLFGGPYGALAQATIRPFDKFAIALTYLHAYDDGSGNAPPGGFFGSENSIYPFGPFPTSTNGFGIESQYAFSSKFILSGWYYYARAKAEAGFGKGSEATIQAWAVALAFPDLFKKGNLGGIVVGMPSKATSNDVRGFEDRDTTIQLEAFYKYQINDHIGITPGFIVITNSEHNSANDTTFVGLIRTNFNF